MTVFEGLLLAHVAGDWLFQTEWQALNKATDWRAMAVHVTTYHLIVLGVLGVQLGFDTIPIYPVVLALALLHAMLDRPGTLQQIMSGLHIVRERPAERWLRLAVDQSMHLLLLGLASVALTRLA